MSDYLCGIIVGVLFSAASILGIWLAGRKNKAGRLLTLTALLLLLPAFGNAGVVAQGSVSQANMKLSTVNGTAFVDFSSAGVFTNYAGHKLTITDSTGKKLVGYISTMGIAQTTGSELHTSLNAASLTNEANGVTGWTSSKLNAFLSQVTSVADGSYALEMNANGGPVAGACASIDLQSLGLVDGDLFTLSFKRRHVGTGNAWRSALTAATTGGTTGLTFDSAVTTGVVIYGDKSGTGTMSASYRYLFFGENSGGNDGGVYVDSLTVKKIITPSATGATIVSTKDGSVFNWTSKDASFTLNDAGGYTYTIERQTGGMSLMWW